MYKQLDKREIHLIKLALKYCIKHSEVSRENQLEIKNIIKNLDKPSEDILIFARFADIILKGLESRSHFRSLLKRDEGYISPGHSKRKLI